jgi:hypothetical protein
VTGELTWQHFFLFWGGGFQNLFLSKALYGLNRALAEILIIDAN